jgi:hypothetical protein
MTNTTANIIVPITVRKQTLIAGAAMKALALECKAYNIDFCKALEWVEKIRLLMDDEKEAKKICDEVEHELYA